MANFNLYLINKTAEIQRKAKAFLELINEIKEIKAEIDRKSVQMSQADYTGTQWEYLSPTDFDTFLNDVQNGNIDLNTLSNNIRILQ
jgi:hypothetical protein